MAAALLVDGRPLRVFCSNDYLGLAQHPEVIAALQAVSAQFGAGAARRIWSPATARRTPARSRARAFTGRERALLFSTGYMANLGVLSAFAGRGEVVLQDRLNHASLIDGAAPLRCAPAALPARGRRHAALVRPIVPTAR